MSPRRRRYAGRLLPLYAEMSSSTYTSATGQPFFSANHLTDIDNAASPTQSNDLTTLALNVSNYGAARTALRRFKGRDGQPLSYGKTTLVVPPELEEPALVLATSKTIAPGTFGGLTGNVGSQENIYAGKVGQPLVIEELTHPKIWYLFRTDAAIRPVLIQNRKNVTFVSKVDPMSENVFWNDELVWGADCRKAYDVTLWWLAIRCGAGL